MSGFSDPVQGGVFISLHEPAEFRHLSPVPEAERGNGHFNAVLPFKYIHTVIPVPCDGTVRIWNLEQYREVGKYDIITYVNLSGGNFKLTIINKKDKEILRATGAKV